MRRVLCVASVAICVSGCRSTGPSCTDQYGRGSDQPDQLRISCTAVGADLQCSAVATNTGELYVYCPVTLTVTGQTSWSSSDSTIAAFSSSPAGFLKVLAAGRVQVNAAYGILRSSTTSFAVDPRSAPEALLQVSVIVEDSRTSARVPDVTVEIAPERGPAQICVTNQFGACSPFPEVLPGTTRIKASKAGYQTVEISLAPPAGSLFQSAFLKLTPVS
jgi:hypothetical protein